ncbi:MAG: N-acetyl-gamma-glutamyl-phosphate reductase [Saprospiraceae bacterium]|nr:N-acetyl-gamma-glutamyl-phosphate reductase [Saprospiraceae bacterium]
MKKIKVGIIGGAGYTAGELIRILLWHPNAEIAFVHSKSQFGKPISDIHSDLIGETSLSFTNQISNNINVLFLCQGHGHSISFLKENNLPKELKIIDLSRDFRLGNQLNRNTAVEEPKNDFLYGLPELNKNQIQNTRKIANPGCFATAIQLALLPLAKAGLLKKEVHIHALTGSTGAGQKPVSTTHFSWRNNNVSIYKAFQHQHLDEIKQSLNFLQDDFSSDINFLPVRGDFSRGIFASLYTKTAAKEADLRALYEAYYKDQPFVTLTNQNPNLKQVINTNKCILYLEKNDDKILIISIIDNLIKGASGQAVQNMNLMFGLEETTGLKLKAMAF